MSASIGAGPRVFWKMLLMTCLCLSCGCLSAKTPMAGKPSNPQETEGKMDRLGR
jgi:hypothetical protein